MTASRPPSRTAIFSRAWGCRSIGASTVPRWPVGHAPDEGQVAAPHLAGAAVVGELLGQRLMRAVVLGHHHQPGGVLVEPVHDARPLARRRCRTGCAPQWAISALTSVPVSWPAAGCTTRPVGLVDDDDVVVLIDDIERDILAGGLGGDRLRHVDCDRIAGGDMISGVADGGASGGARNPPGSALSAASATAPAGAPRARGRAGPIPRRRRR